MCFQQGNVQPFLAVKQKPEGAFSLCPAVEFPCALLCLVSVVVIPLW